MSYRPLDIPPEPGVHQVGDVESLLLHLDSLLAYEGQAGADDLQRGGRGEDLALNPLAEGVQLLVQPGYEAWKRMSELIH